MGKEIVSPEQQSATFVELFFDLVFVFAITQMVYLFHHDLTWAGAGKAILVFWMIWWAWTQFTWALNSADTTNVFVELCTLIATALAFFMAVAVPNAWGDTALMFAITYVAVRAVGLTLYSLVGLHNEVLRPAVRNFATLSVGGLACALVGGILGGEAQVWLWGMTIVLDVIAATFSGSDEWDWSIDAAHFAERHGLIVIIALGESLIVAAGGLVAVDLEADLLLVGVLAVLLSCGLWWTYFRVMMPRMEAGLAGLKRMARGRVARDVYSFGHFLMLAGVIAYAVALEEVIAHPHEALPAAGRLAMAFGLLLFLAGPSFGLWRATGQRSTLRLLVACGCAGAVWLLGGVQPAVTLAVALIGVLSIATIDELHLGDTAPDAH